MNTKSAILVLLIGSSTFFAYGCNSGVEQERSARLAAEQRTEAERQKAETERQQWEQQRYQHDKEKHQLWIYLVGISFIAVVLLFVGAGLGSSARKDAELAGRTPAKMPGVEKEINLAPLDH